MQKSKAMQCWKEIEAILKKYDAELIHERESSAILNLECQDGSVEVDIA